MAQDKQNTNGKDLISVVMPVKNGEKYLIECLNSILNQSVSDWELVVVNDNSNDGTEQILLDYVKKDVRITYFNSMEKGIIPALQLAYSKSVGNYISRMDADDIMPPYKLEKLKSALSKEGLIATGFVNYFSESGIGDGYKKYENWLNSLTSKGINFSEIYKECVIPSPCWMMSRNDFEKCGGFDSDVYPEDYDLVFRMRAAGLKVVGINEVLHLWRDHYNRSSRTDENYLDNRFLELKISWFLKSDYDKSKELVLLGAGKKAKQIAKHLIQHKIDFLWACDNPNKIGHNIYGRILVSSKALSSGVQIIGLIAGDSQLEYEELTNVTWFC